MRHDFLVIPAQASRHSRASFSSFPRKLLVIPAQAGIQKPVIILDPRMRGDDEQVSSPMRSG